MIEDLVELENNCNKVGLIIDPGIKNMYETLCNDQKFSALTEIHIRINWNRINCSYYSNPPTESASMMSQNISIPVTNNNYAVNDWYSYNYSYEYEYRYCVYFLHHTTLIPIYKIEIRPNLNFTKREVYDVFTYQKPKEKDVWDYNGSWNSIQFTYADKNNLKEIIQQKFELLMQDD